MIYDFIVVGGGISGLYFAINSIKAGKKVLVVTKDKLDNSNTYYAQGGIAAVLDRKKDSRMKHYKDTVSAGSNVNKKSAVLYQVKNAPKFIKELLSLGVHFDKDDLGKLRLTKEGGHSERRIAFSKDITGQEIQEALIKKVNKINLKIKEKSFAIDLIMDRRVCKGVMCLEGKELIPYYAKAVVLATGGAAEIYENSTNPEISTGDGFAIAKRARAKLNNMEFVQFHPTKLYMPRTRPFLITEALRGEGAILRNKNKVAFMKKYHDLKDLAPRDIVSRAIFNEMKHDGGAFVYLDATHIEKKFLIKRFPNINRQLREYGIDMTKDLIPVTPAAHYMCGGVKISLSGKTSVKGLYAIGEVSCSGIHGGNRLASNSMMESMVFGKRAFNSAMRFIKYRRVKPNKLKIPKYTYVNKQYKEIRQKLQKIMWESVGIIRHEDELWKALNNVNQLDLDIKLITKNKINQDIIEIRNMVIVSKEIIRAAIKRKKSVGCHYIE